MLSLDHGDLYRKFLPDRSTSLVFRCRKIRCETWFHLRDGLPIVPRAGVSRLDRCQGRFGAMLHFWSTPKKWVKTPNCDRLSA